MASMPVATSSPIKRSAGDDEERKEGQGSSREPSPAAKRQKVDGGPLAPVLENQGTGTSGPPSGSSGGKQGKVVSPNKSDGPKAKASSGLPKLDVAAAASHASDSAEGFFCSFSSNTLSAFQGRVAREQLHFLTHQRHLTQQGRQQKKPSRRQRQRRGRECSYLFLASLKTSLTGVLGSLQFP